MVEILSYGVEEEFEMEKLLASIIKAGASEEVAKKVAKKIKIWEGMTTDEIRKQVMEELSKLDPEAAKRYDLYKKKKLAKLKDRLDSAYIVSA
jgi:2-phosphoglycerate kinase